MAFQHGSKVHSEGMREIKEKVGSIPSFSTNIMIEANQNFTGLTKNFNW